ncbi:hypothetical protein ACOME3_010056 [Neoechinorhynchus agilis]
MSDTTHKPKRQGKKLLYEFVLSLLNDRSQSHIICWMDWDGSFVINQPDEFACRWGLETNNQRMNYDKVSRCLRHYYARNILSKKDGKYQYKFNLNTIQQLRYNAQRRRSLHVPHCDHQQPLRQLNNFMSRSINEFDHHNQNQYMTQYISSPRESFGPFVQRFDNVIQNISVNNMFINENEPPS